ncbi:MAG: hypothetical protein ACO3JL_13800, partial [Myxococcota bacterium]
YLCGTVGCDCRDPAYPDDETSMACLAPVEWLGDGYCDDSANEEACAWDEGDCCPSTCEAGTYPCGENGYRCLDPDVAPDAGTGLPADDDTDAGRMPGEEPVGEVDAGALAGGDDTRANDADTDDKTNASPPTEDGAEVASEGRDREQTDSGSATCSSSLTSSRPPSLLALIWLSALLVLPARRSRH